MSKRPSDSELPRDAKTGEPLPPREQPGYYPGFSTLAQEPYWDAATRKTVEMRLNPPPLRFFTPAEARTVEAALERVLPQSDRDEAHRIPILQFIDERLFAKRFNGYTFEGAPDEDETHRLGAHALETIAQAQHGQAFADLSGPLQEAILLAIRAGDPPGPPALWERMPPQLYWSMLVQDAVGAYYAHPYAWDEIGFGGPAYPRGYMRVTNGQAEPWEKEERRYEWRAPEASRSDRLEPNEALFSEKFKQSGQAGTH